MLSNNDIFRRTRYMYNFNDDAVKALFASADYKASLEEIAAWLKKEEVAGYNVMLDIELAAFLNGLINTKRGKKEGKQVPLEKYLDNNTILRKFKIALNLKDEDIINILSLTGMKVGKAELSAFFRKMSHKNYKTCNDQLLRNFLNGLLQRERSKNKKVD